MTNVTIGSISTGTLRTNDLLDAFAGELSRLTNDTHKLLSDYQSHYATVDADDPDAQELVNELQDALSELAPPHVYFGNLEGDGADFGFWPELDFGFCTLRAGDSDDERVDDDCGIIIHVSDHGNVAVYDLERNLLWSAV